MKKFKLNLALGPMIRVREILFASGCSLMLRFEHNLLIEITVNSER